MMLDFGLMFPKAFKNFGNRFHQDIFEIFDISDGLSEVIGDVLSGLNDREFRVVKNYLEEILSGPYSDEQLNEIWEQACTDFFFSDVRLFLTQVLEEMKARE